MTGQINGADPVITNVINPKNSPPVSTESSLSQDQKSATRLPLWRRVLSTLNWMPLRCRWNPESPHVFSMSMNVLFAFAGAFTVANLYYNHPILNILAHEFNVPYETASHIPTFMQAGYVTGLLFLCPLGDVFPRRPFVLGMILFTSTMWIGLCITSDFNTFCAISYITAITTVTPQMMLPLVGDLAPPHKRATALAVVVTGNLAGVLLARILSGVVTQFTSWRNIYWLALGLQYLIFTLLWLFMPDYPSTNPDGMNYFKMLWSILLICRRHAVLMQASVISFCTSATTNSFWTTLTFLLAGAPYHYNSLIIGLFALIGVFGMLLGPFYARILINHFVPLFSVIVGELINIVGIIIGTYTGRFTVAGPIIQAFALDAGLQITQIANRSAIYAIEPKARNRVNTAFMVISYLGQLTGTAAGNHFYAEGGWIASGSLNVGFIAFALVICALRGPWEEGWIGWGGGWSVKKKDKLSGDGKTVEQRSELMPREKAKPVVDDGGETALGSDDKALETLAGEDAANVIRKMSSQKETT